MRQFLFAAVLVAGCGIDETVFIPEYADHWCRLQVDCADPALAVFDGSGGKDACLAVEGPRIEAWGEDCKYRAGKAKQCLEELEAVTCPKPDTPLEAVLPTACTETYQDCELPGNDVDTAL